MQPLPRWPGPFYFSSGVVDICIKFQVTEGVVRAALPCNMVLGMRRKHSAVCCPAQSVQRCEGTGTASCRWKGLLVWALVFAGKEGRKSVEASAQNGWTCLAAEDTNLYVKPYTAIPTHPFQSFSTAIPALSVGACVAAQAALVSGGLPLTPHAVSKKIL